jgi:hypothetical protein
MTVSSPTRALLSKSTTGAGMLATTVALVTTS